MHTIGRFAPSPSGRMHLGNVLCALLAWLSARQQNGEFLLRIEDLDEMRCPRSFADLIIDDLRWLGLDWDGEIPYQSERTAVYEKYEAILREKGLLYPCFCSRAALHAASAPHLSDGRVVYAGTCRDLTPEEVAEKRKKRAPATRVRVPERTITFTDGVYGEYTETLTEECGDFIIRRSDGVFAYQLAVVVDDSQIWRGVLPMRSCPRTTSVTPDRLSSTTTASSGCMSCSASHRRTSFISRCCATMTGAACPSAMRTSTSAFCGRNSHLSRSSAHLPAPQD